MICVNEEEWISSLGWVRLALLISVQWNPIVLWPGRPLKSAPTREVSLAVEGDWMRAFEGKNQTSKISPGFVATRDTLTLAGSSKTSRLLASVRMTLGLSHWDGYYYRSCFLHSMEWCEQETRVLSSKPSKASLAFIHSLVISWGAHLGRPWEIVHAKLNARQTAKYSF